MIRAKYKKKAWLLDDDLFLEGIYAKGKFFPDNHGCGFSFQKIRRRDVGNIIFF